MRPKGTRWHAAQNAQPIFLLYASRLALACLNKLIGASESSGSLLEQSVCQTQHHCTLGGSGGRGREHNIRGPPEGRRCLVQAPQQQGALLTPVLATAQPGLRCCYWQLPTCEEAVQLSALPRGCSICRFEAPAAQSATCAAQSLLVKNDAHSQAGREAGAPPEFVTTSAALLPGAPDFDVVVCGGTLGIFLACALLLQGYRRAPAVHGPASITWPCLPKL